MVMWIFLSACVILINKQVLAFSGFPYPIALTLSHMGFCSTLAWVIISLGFADKPNVPADVYIRHGLLLVLVPRHDCHLCSVREEARMLHAATRRGILPIGLLFSGTLWLGNAAYLTLEVSFIQMLKVRIPRSPSPAICRECYTA
jgi:hypothetical protein